MPPGCRRALRPALPALQAAAVPALDGPEDQLFGGGAGLHCAVGDYAAVVEFLLEKGAALISSDFLMFFNFNGHGIPLDFSSQASLQSSLEIQEP